MCYGCQTACFYIGRHHYKILIQQCYIRKSNLCAICFVDDDLHLVKVGEKGWKQYSKLRCDEKLEKVFSERSELFLQITCTCKTFLFTPTPYIHLYWNGGFFAKIVNGFKLLAIPGKASSWIFDSVLNASLVRLQICKLGLKIRYMHHYVRSCIQFKQMLIHNIKSKSIRCMLQITKVLKIMIFIKTWPLHKTILSFCCYHSSKAIINWISRLLDARFAANLTSSYCLVFFPGGHI